MEPCPVEYGYVTNTRMFSSKMPFCGTKYTLFREAFIVGKISSNSSGVGSDGRTRIMRGILLRVLWRRSLDEGRVIGILRIRRKPRCLYAFMHTHPQAITLR